MLTNFLEKLRDNDPNIKDMIQNMLIKRQELTKDSNKKENSMELNKYKNIDHLFMYGIDELFINKYVINYMVKKYRKIGIVYFSDNLKYYLKDMILWDKSSQNNIQLFLKKLLKYNYIENDKHNKKNIELLNSKLSVYNSNSIEEYENKMKNLKYFYKTLVEFKNRLVIDQNYLSNLGKHFNTKYQFNFFMFHNKKFLNYFATRLQIYEKRDN
jgi:hypothetical protein